MRSAGLEEVHPAGLEPATFGSVDRRKPQQIQGFTSFVAPMVATDTAENGGGRLMSVAETDRELARIVVAWPMLSATAKRMILAALEADQGQTN